MSKKEAVVTTEQFMADLEKQSKKQRQMEIDSGILISQADICRRMGKSRTSIQNYCRKQQMFSIESPEGRPVYPAFFLHNKYDPATLQAVCQALGDLPGGSKWDFFKTPRISLGGKTPLEAIVAGDLESVMAAARAFADE